MPQVLIPVLLVLGLWYHLHSQGIATRTIWLNLNLLDTYRGLRTQRVNGRKIGIRTRRLAMRDSLVAWVVLISMYTVAEPVERVLGWLPLYGTVKAITSVAFLATRVASSKAIYDTFFIPFIKRYETPIDLTLTLLRSLVILIGHYTYQAPIVLVVSSIRTCISIARAPFSYLTSKATQVAPVPVLVDEPDVDENTSDDIELVVPTRLNKRIDARKPQRSLDKEHIPIRRAMTPPAASSSSSRNTLLVPIAPTPLRRSPRRNRAMIDGTDDPVLLALPSQTITSEPSNRDVAGPSTNAAAPSKALKPTQPPSRAAPSRPPSLTAAPSRPPSRHTAPSLYPPNVPRLRTTSSTAIETGKSKPSSLGRLKDELDIGSLQPEKVPHSKSAFTLGGSIARHTSTKKPESTRMRPLPRSATATTFSIYPSLPLRPPEEKVRSSSSAMAPGRIVQTRPTRGRARPKIATVLEEHARTGDKRKAVALEAEVGAARRKRGRTEAGTKIDGSKDTQFV
ncbi:hypothetical protein BCR39DRAFT_107379 [Naematelia encephala]|uniref:Uncharacterized protein n=1 Tax=Naematelia encephala TaxID=71784 RepID=A0A1Y2B7L0_9TREE|nr:hypothetical protein BCR39DRAFT_107379 [Naematelia encephala]